MSNDKLREKQRLEEDWWIYRRKCEPHDGVDRLVDSAPPWRRFEDASSLPAESIQQADMPSQAQRDNPERGRTYLADDEQIRLVNLALHLRRPLLITGKPGTGKSSLAYSVAYQLRLGPVLRWSVTSRSTLLEGLYRYDAIGRLQEAQLNPKKAVEISNYLSLGPLGTALIPSARPRVLLIDEIDKSDIDLPNDLLNIFEEGEYEIPELARYTSPDVPIRLFDGDVRVIVTKGKVRCCAFPFVIMTSNGERDFPGPLLRRCLQLEIAPPNPEVLTSVVEAHLGPELGTRAATVIERFLDRRAKEGHLANDQLLNAVFLLKEAIGLKEENRADVEKALFRPLGGTDPS